MKLLTGSAIPWFQAFELCTQHSTHLLSNKSIVVFVEACLIRLMVRDAQIRPPPAVLTTSSADVDVRKSKERKNKLCYFLVYVPLLSTPGKTRHELAMGYSLAKEFCWFLSPPTQPKPATSLPDGQGLTKLCD